MHGRIKRHKSQKEKENKELTVSLKYQGRTEKMNKREKGIRDYEHGFIG